MSSRQSWRFLAVLTLGLVLPGTALQAQKSAAMPDARVVGGKAVKSCQWPSAMILDTGRFTCSGTLIHPKIFITAAHCLKGGTYTVFSGDGNKGENKKTLKERKVEYCRKHPKFQGTHKTPTLDFAYCKLQEEVKDVAPMPILMGCEVDYLRQNNDLDVTVVGFGYIDPKTKSKIGTKYEVTTKFSGISGGLAKIGLIGKGPLQGDSGGPCYVRLPEDKFNKDAGWRVFGITSTSRGNGAPDGRALYGLIHTFVEYLEEDSGIDVTPCTDADGTWNPGKDCKGAYSDPYEASGDWVNGCNPSTPGGYIASCGEPFESEPEDQEAPSLEIVAPKAQQVFPAKHEPIEVKVRVQDESEIKEVLLQLDGESQKPDTQAPYGWTLESLDAGVHELVAKAIDAAGNQGSSEPLTFEVKAEQPDKEKESQDSNEPSPDNPSPDHPSKAPESKKEEPQGSNQEGQTSDPQGDEGQDKPRGCAFLARGSGFGPWGLGVFALFLAGRRRKS